MCVGVKSNHSLGQVAFTVVDSRAAYVRARALARALDERALDVTTSHVSRALDEREMGFSRGLEWTPLGCL